MDLKILEESEPKFPAKEMIVLASAVFASAISLSGLFPYVPFMVIHFGAANNEDEAGFASGYIASAMMSGRLVSSYYWGTIADQWGRKPCLLFGCGSIFLFSITFGCAINMWQALISRFLLGFFNPIWGVAKTLVSDLCSSNKTHEAKAMGLTTGCWSLGLIFGPAFGGLLANPAELYPDTIVDNSLFRKYPYLLPNLVTAFFAAIGAFSVYYLFPETLKAKDRNNNNNNNDEENEKKSMKSMTMQTSVSQIDLVLEEENRYGKKEDINKYDRNNHKNNNNDNNQDDGDGDVESISQVYNNKGNDDEDNNNNNNDKADGSNNSNSISDLLRIPGVMNTMICYFFLSLNSICFDECVPLWAMASPAKGGIALPQHKIGVLLTITGGILTFYTFVIYPPLAVALGKVKGFRYGLMFSAPFFLGITLLNRVDTSSPMHFPLLVICYAMAKAGTALSFSSLALVLNSCAAQDRRASLNGLSMSFGSLSKSFGPFTASILFAWSLNSGLSFPLDYHLVFLIVALSSVGTTLLPLPSPDNSTHANDSDNTITKSASAGVRSGISRIVMELAKKAKATRVETKYSPLATEEVELEGK